MIGIIAQTWRDRPEVRTSGLHDRLLRLWVEAEATRLTSQRLRQQLAVGSPGPEGSAVKLSFARLNQEISGLELEMLGEEGLAYDDWAVRRPGRAGCSARGPGSRARRPEGSPVAG